MRSAAPCAGRCALCTVYCSTPRSVPSRRGYRGASSFPPTARGSVRRESTLARPVGAARGQDRKMPPDQGPPTRGLSRSRVASVEAAGREGNLDGFFRARRPARPAAPSTATVSNRHAVMLSACLASPQVAQDSVRLSLQLGDCQPVAAHSPLAPLSRRASSVLRRRRRCDAGVARSFRCHGAEHAEGAAALWQNAAHRRAPAPPVDNPPPFRAGAGASSPNSARPAVAQQPPPPTRVPDRGV